VVISLNWSFHMDTLDAIFTRRSVSALKPGPLPREVIERLLSAAVQAPNHYRLRPWRFVVLEGAARERLGDLLAGILLSDQPGLPLAALEKERAKPLRAPVLIAVGVERTEDPRSVPLENICAVAAACQNLLLAAHALGLGAIWRTGAMVFDARVKTFLGLDPEQPLLGILYVGNSAAEQSPAAPRPSFEDRTTWMS
jgi:nitroreductase